MTLTQQLKERADATAANKSAEDLDILNNSVRIVDAAGIVNNALKVGDTAPDFALADAVRVPRRRSNARGHFATDPRRVALN